MKVKGDKLIADEGKVLVRKIDDRVMGDHTYLNRDYTTGSARDDQPEHYYEKDKPKEK